MDADSLLVGRYQMGRPIGAGGIGQVWTAHDLVLGRQVAIKVQEIDPELDDAAFERFVREARSAAALQHPNVVTIFDSGTDQDTAFLVMELLPGPTLTGYLAQRGPLSELEAIDLTIQVASGLAAVHGAGVVHRDIKPANLMFDARGQLKIVDFGIARLTQAAASRLTATNAVIGSPPYLSPEQLRGKPADERSDIYCLGGVLMTMLTGRAPFEGTHPLDLLPQHLHGAPPQVRDRRPDIDPALNALVGQMLNKAPEDRPQSAREVLGRLTGTIEAPEPGAPAAAAMSRPTAAPSPAGTLPAGPAGRPPRPRSMVGAGLLAGAGAMALVAAVVIVMAGRGQVPSAGRLEPSPLALLPTVAITGGAEGTTAAPTPTTPTTSAPTTSRTELSSRTSTPTAAKARSATPSPSAPTSATQTPPPAPRSPASRSPAAHAADTDRGTQSLQSALADLRASVDEVTSSGAISAKDAGDLQGRVDGLADQLAKKQGAEATRKIDDFDRYLAGLTSREKLTPDGEQRIAAALSAVRNLVADG